MPAEMKRQGQQEEPGVLARIRKGGQGEGFGGRDLSPLSTYVTHKMLGSQKLRKRILDDANRVAFYVPCALVEGATGEFRARSFFPDFVRFCPDFRLFTRLAEALGSWGLG